MAHSTGRHDDDVASLLAALPLDTLDDLADMPLPSPSPSAEVHDLLPLDELSALYLEPLFSPQFPVSAAETESAEDSQDSQGVELKDKPKRTRRVRPSAYDSNRARNQRRHEVAYLRSRVQEMEQELALVRSRSSSETETLAHAQPTGVVVTKSYSGAVTTQANVWEKIAERQLKERRRAETENERLKAALETQIKVARSLEAILKKRSTTQSLEDCGIGNYTHVYGRGSGNGSDASTFDMLLRDAHKIYVDAERLVGPGGTATVNGPESSSRDAKLRATDAGLLVEIFATDLLPFTLRETSTAAWQYFSHGKNQLPVPSRLYYERVRDDSASSEDTVIERSGMELVSNGTKAVVQLQQVLRRYQEADRVVVVWNAIAQPVEFESKPFSGFHLREWGCMVLKPHVAASGDEPPPLTVLQSCFFITPEFQIDNVGEMTGDGDVGRLTEFVLTTTTNSIASWRQRIENILMDNHLQAPLAQNV